MVEGVAEVPLELDLVAVAMPEEPLAVETVALPPAAPAEEDVKLLTVGDATMPLPAPSAGVSPEPEETAGSGAEDEAEED
jgi:hypothetical protein